MAWLKCEVIEHYPGPPSRFIAWVPGLTDNVLLTKSEVEFDVKKNFSLPWTFYGKALCSVVKKGERHSVIRFSNLTNNGRRQVTVYNEFIEYEPVLSRLAFTKFTESSNA